MTLALGQAHAQNNPYIDDKLVHFGFFLGLDMLSYNIEENDAVTQLSMPGADTNASKGWCNITASFLLRKHSNSTPPPTST